MWVSLVTTVRFSGDSMPMPTFFSGSKVLKFWDGGHWTLGKSNETHGEFPRRMAICKISGEGKKKKKDFISTEPEHWFTGLENLDSDHSSVSCCVTLGDHITSSDFPSFPKDEGRSPHFCW